DAFPLTSNGKLDRGALPVPDWGDSSRRYVGPRNEIECQMVEVWHSVLKVERIGIQDDFFQLGGDSIQSIQVAARLQRLGLQVYVQDIFKHRTILRLAEAMPFVEGRQEEDVLSGRFDLLPIQRWFFKQGFRKPNHWNQSLIVKVPPLDVERLRAVILKLSAHHDVLRLTFGEGYQEYGRGVIPELVTAKDFSLCTSWQSDFDLREGPTWRIGYIETGYLFIAAHHLIIDGVSWRLLIDDIRLLYEGGELGAKSSSYRRWVETVNAYAHAEEERSYWDEQLALGDVSVHLLDEPTVGDCELDEGLTASFHEMHKTYHTETNDILLTALAYTLRDWLGGDVHGITLEGHGREFLDDKVDVSRTVGWFTTKYPVKLEVKESLKASICHIKEGLRRVPNKGIGYGVLNQDERLPDIQFNYLGQFDEGGEWHITDKPSGCSVDLLNERACLLRLNGVLLNHRLSFRAVTYTPDGALIAELFKKHLTQLIQHCASETGHYYTPSDFIVPITQSLLDKLQLEDTAIEAIYPANSLQQGFLYHALSHPEDDAYRVQLLLDYHEALDVGLYEEAWRLAVETYPILRTYFNWDETLIQVISKKGGLWFKYYDGGDVEAIQRADRCIGFDFKTPGLLRIHLIKQGPRHYTLMKTTHHSISDGWSGPILIHTVHRYYQALLQGKRPQVIEDRAYLEAQAYIAKHQTAAKAYWSRRLEGIAHGNDINALLSQPMDLDMERVVHTPRVEHVEIGGEVYQALKAFSQREGITLNVLTQFAWHKLLQVYTGDERTIVGTTVSGRGIAVARLEQSVGLYINTLPLILTWDDTLTILEQLQRIAEEISSLNTYSFVELATLQTGGRRLFHSLFIFENYPIEEHVGGQQSLRLEFRGGVEKLDYALAMLACEKKEGLVLSLKYDEQYLETDKAICLLSQFQRILAQIPRLFESSHTRLTLLSSDEYERLVYGWNETQRPY
ncbi:condensation domain-containing protein, partial [Legionella oakridgensis]|uniref:condensation domain-containing protein n=1 Tax=Legionella oakridgensis TaxID=29423 RepID=UPI000562BAEF